jgi:hypothetical protein
MRWSTTRLRGLAGGCVSYTAPGHEEFKAYVGYGHSTWQEGVRLCDAAEANQFIAFHHQPEKTDNLMLEAVDAELRRLRPNSGSTDWRGKIAMVILPGKKMG